MHAYGGDTLAYFALRDDKSYFFSSDGRGDDRLHLPARATRWSSGDPIGAAGVDPGRVVDEFLAFCRERGWRVAFLAVREADLPLYAARGMHARLPRRRGDHPLRPLHASTGPAMKAVRAAVDAGRRATTASS